MKIFKDKHFKYEMQSLDDYYKCILSCEINPCSSSWQGVEEDCETKCLNQHLKSHFMWNNHLSKFINYLSKNRYRSDLLIYFDKYN